MKNSRYATEFYKMINSGKLMEGFEKFYHPDVVMQESGEAHRKSKDLNREYEKKFLGMIKEFHGAGVYAIASNEAVIRLLKKFFITINRKKMTANEAMRWRYATKRMLNKAVPEASVNKIIEAIHLSPSSLGLQPYEVFVISDPEVKNKILPIAFNQKQVVESSCLLVFIAWDTYTEERIDKVFDHLARERNLPPADMEGQKNAAKKYFSATTDEAQFYHAAKQSGIALGVAVLTAALEGIDASPMEGFNPAALDEFLGLKEKGLRSTALLALGYRDEINDWSYKLKKVRKPLRELVTVIK